MFIKQKTLMALAAPVLLSLALAACQEPNRAADYRDDFPLTVTPDKVSLTVTAPSGTGELSGQEGLDFERFVRDFHDRGQNALTLTAPGGQSGRKNAEKVRALLLDAGIPKNEIRVVGAGTGSAVTVSFEAFKAEVPECGKFTSKSNPNWTNRRDTNYGCATRRNLGLMVQDPRDIKEANTVSGGDGPRSVNRVKGYRSGGAAAPAAATTATGTQ